MHATIHLDKTTAVHDYSKLLSVFLWPIIFKPGEKK
jgi:hypothetical protein